ncbi:ribbon-helix-helix domain-containing protein [Candidatus Accumulibacter aalborgensis]|nr:CopG family transcriptional regulator [Candidatus Accumulibacter aalborgensis]
MRTTLDIDDDVLAAAKELAGRRRLSAGQVVSQLLRQALTGQGAPTLPAGSAASDVLPVAGFRPFPAGTAVVTNDEVNALREKEGV